MDCSAVFIGFSEVSPRSARPQRRRRLSSCHQTYPCGSLRVSDRIINRSLHTLPATSGLLVRCLTKWIVTAKIEGTLTTAALRLSRSCAPDQWLQNISFSYPQLQFLFNSLYSVALSPQANYTHWATATCWRNLVLNLRIDGCRVVSAADPPRPLISVL
jgi:hypothetical protein